MRKGLLYLRQFIIVNFTNPCIHFREKTFSDFLRKLCKNQKKRLGLKG